MFGVNKHIKNLLLFSSSAVVAAIISYIVVGMDIQNTRAVDSASSKPIQFTQTAIFAWGCFWCMEWIFESQDGVFEAYSWYVGGSEWEANYKAVSWGQTSHREAVEVHYDPSKISYEKLVELYWTQIDATDAGGQFADRWFHYTTAIYYGNDEEQQIAETSKQNLEDSGKFKEAIATLILPKVDFFRAEEYHQDYYKKSALRYKQYKRGSGRAGFIEENWSSEIEELTAPSLKEWEKSDTSSEREKIGAFLDDTYSDASLRERLTPIQYHVTQEDGTERPFTNEYHDEKRAGIYVDIIDGTPLYSSLDKYDSGSGWPSFTKTIEQWVITKHEDRKLFSMRTEARSASSDAHLGHIFPDGPEDKWGIRHCINSAALRFIPLEDLESQWYGEYKQMF